MSQGKIREEDQIPEVGYFQFYIDAYRELNTCRLGAMSPGPIPFSAIVEYSRINNLNEEDFYDLLYIIRLMDNKHLELESKSSGNKHENSKNKGSSRR